MKKNNYERVVFLLQGGGALGTYQVGVCEALLELVSNLIGTIGTSKQHWQSGYNHAQKALKNPSWLDATIDGDSGASIHDFR